MDAITYCQRRINEINREAEFVFDLKLPVDFKPNNQDGEVECFYLMSIDEVNKWLKL